MALVHFSPVGGVPIFPILMTEFGGIAVTPGEMMADPINPAPLVVFKTGVAREFATGVDTAVLFNVLLAQGYADDSSVQPNLHWTGEDAVAGDVRWKLSGSWVNIGDTFSGSANKFITDANSLVLDEHSVGQFPVFTVPGQKFGSMMLLTVTRLGADPLDTYAGSAFLSGFNIVYEQQNFGSVTQLPA